MSLEPDLIAAAVAKLLGDSNGGDVVSAYLFGSHAERRAHRESDVDLAVLLRPETGASRDHFEKRLRLTSELIALLHHNEVDVVVLNDAPPLLARRIPGEACPPLLS